MASSEMFWGYLEPRDEDVHRIDFWKVAPRIVFGNSPDCDIVLPGDLISPKQCTIAWSGVEATKSVRITEYSEHGTWINHVRLKHGETRILDSGDEIAFGTTVIGKDGYHFFFRQKMGGSKIGQYDFARELGNGTFGTVYKAMHIPSGHLVAIKKINKKKKLREWADKHKAENPSHRRRLERQFREMLENFIPEELAIVQSLDHPYIVKAYDYITTKDADYFVLQLAQGGDLWNYVDKQPNGRLTEKDTVYFAYQIFKAMEYFHIRGIVHRDLKPEILLSDGNPPHILITDFGLATAVDVMSLCRTTNIGTPNYMAPEISKQDGIVAYDYHVDCFSVGIILCVLLTGVVPKRGELSELAFVTMLREQLTKVHASVKAIDVITQLVAYEPKARMTSMGALVHPWLAAHAAKAPPISSDNSCTSDIFEVE